MLLIIISLACINAASAMADDVVKVDKTKLETLATAYHSYFDEVHGGSKSLPKTLDRFPFEYAIRMSFEGHKEDTLLVEQYLKGLLSLQDLEWGGFFSSAKENNWTKLDFTKTLEHQSQVIIALSQAYRFLGKEEYLQAALQTYDYVKNFLTDKQGFVYTKQSGSLVEGMESDNYFAASAADRHEMGMPNVSKDIYASDNALYIEALINIHMATKDQSYLQTAIRLARLMLSRFRAPTGLVRPQQSENMKVSNLKDNVRLSRALLVLFQATGERFWLTHSERTAQATITQYPTQPGLWSEAYSSSPATNNASISIHITTARFLEHLFQATGNSKYRKAAHDIVIRLLNSQGEYSAKESAGLLLLLNEIESQPVHLTIVGKHTDLVAQQLMHEALFYFLPYKRIDWWDRDTGTLPRHDVKYPVLPRPAAFICTDSKCSVPIFNPKKFANKVDRLLKRKTSDASN